MKTKLDHITLGAFLHDIGKVMQRAEIPVTDQTQSFMKADGPSRDGRSTHYHVQWTSQFFEDNLGYCGLPPCDLRDERASYLAFKHHNPSTPLQQIIAEADRLSSGMDRGESLHERDVHKRKPMVPLRYLVRLEGEKPPEPFPTVPLIPLTSTDNSTYPQDPNSDAVSLVDKYKELWSSFLKDWENRKADGFEANLALLDALYERYFWCVPASAIDVIPDNSLYEHSRASAAIAGALYLYHEETNSLNLAEVKDREREKFLLVKGDLSGIQNYIFAIAHMGKGRVAKKLRARSFYLNRIVQILAHQIVQEAGLSFLNIVLSAGGNFTLLLPNTSAMRQKLAEREQSCQKWLHDQFHGQISLNLAWIPMKSTDFLEGRLSEKFGDLSTALDRKKYQPLRRIVTENGEWVEDHFVLPKAMTEKESYSGQYDLPSPLGEKKEEELGKELTHANYLIIYDSKQGDYPVFHWSFSMNADSDGGYCFISFKKGVEDRHSNARIPVHYEYRASYTPRDENGQIMPFDRIAEHSEGRAVVAYFKADVDNLGLLLHTGLAWRTKDEKDPDAKKNGWTLSKLATFSRSLDFFFSGRVENILQNDYPSVYTIFSGGDDVLLVGPWNVIHDFARTLQKEWFAFTGRNDHLTLSAGVAITRPLTPVWMASSLVSSAEHKAKQQSTASGVKPKNQLCSLNHLLKWDEVDAVFSEIETIDGWLRNKKCSTAFIRNFLYYAELARLYREEGKIEGLRYLPLLSYNLSRNIKDDSIRTWAERLKNADGDTVRHLQFIANYSLNLNRG